MKKLVEDMERRMEEIDKVLLETSSTRANILAGKFIG